MNKADENRLNEVRAAIKAAEKVREAIQAALRQCDEQIALYEHEALAIMQKPLPGRKKK